MLFLILPSFYFFILAIGTSLTSLSFESPSGFSSLVTPVYSRLNCGLKKICPCLHPQNLGTWPYLEKIKNLEMRSSWMIQVSPKSSKFPYKKHTEERRRGERTRPYRDGDRRGVMSPQAKKALEPAEAGKGEEWALLWILCWQHSPCQHFPVRLPAQDYACISVLKEPV